MIAGGAPRIATQSAQVMDTVGTKSAFDQLFGTSQKSSIFKVEHPVGFEMQLVPQSISMEYVFGAPSHLSSQEAVVNNLQDADPHEKATIVTLLQTVAADIMEKNRVQARKGSLQQG